MSIKADQNANYVTHLSSSNITTLYIR